MTYGHAQRNLHARARITAETVTLLHQLDRLTPDQSSWLRYVSYGVAHRDIDNTRPNALGR